MKRGLKMRDMILAVMVFMEKVVINSFFVFLKALCATLLQEYSVARGILLLCGGRYYSPFF